MAEVPDLEPLDAPQTLAERQARQRLHVKRTYYRKLLEIQTLRKAVEELETELARLELQKRSGATSEISSNQDSGASPEYEAAKQRFQAVLVIKSKLRQENEALESAIADHNRFALKAASWIRGDQPNSKDDPPESSPFILHTPLSVDTCQQTASETFHGIQRFGEKLAYLSTGVTILGWRDKRVLSDDCVTFSLIKEFKNISALELSQRGWNVTGATNGLSQLYSSSMNVTVTSVQHVDDDNEIKLRIMTNADSQPRVNTLFLVSRFAIPNGYVIVIRSLDHDKYVELSSGPEDQWVNFHNWTIFQCQGEQGEHCRVEFGGEVCSNAVADSSMWMLEVLLVALRWESIVIEPVFRLGMGDDE